MEYNFQGTNAAASCPCAWISRTASSIRTSGPGLGVELDMKQLKLVTEITQPVTARAQTYFRPDGSITNW